MDRAIERRLAARRTPGPGEPLGRVRLRTGRDIAVVDVSDGGVLVDGHARLLPGTHVDVHVVLADGRVLIRCRVVRAEVSTIGAGGVSYRAALAFANPADTRAPGYRFPEVVSASPPVEGNPFPPEAPPQR